MTFTHVKKLQDKDISHYDHGMLTPRDKTCWKCLLAWLPRGILSVIHVVCMAVVLKSHLDALGWSLVCWLIESFRNSFTIWKESRQLNRLLGFLVTFRLPSEPGQKQCHIFLPWPTLLPNTKSDTKVKYILHGSWVNVTCLARYYDDWAQNGARAVAE